MMDGFKGQVQTEDGRRRSRSVEASRCRSGAIVENGKSNGCQVEEDDST